MIDLIQPIGSILTAVGVILTSTLAIINRKQLNVIHLLVNDRLDRALEQNAALLTQLQIVHGNPPAERNMSDVLRTPLPPEGEISLKTKILP